jgi:uncharacterized protein
MRRRGVLQIRGEGKVNGVLIRISFSAMTLAATVALAACGGGSGSDTSPAAQIAPGSDNGTVKKEVPVYAGDPAAKKSPQGQATLDKLPTVKPSDAPRVPSIRGSANVPIAQWIDTMENDVASFWQQVFNEAGSAYAPATEVIFSEPVSAGCVGQAQPDFDGQGPFYCAEDEAIYLPVPWFEHTQAPIGDAATAIVIAHENGHRVQDLIGTFDQPVRTFDIEQQADCLAGIWAAYTFERGLIEPGDVEEAVKTLNEAGDAPGTGIDDPRAHGSSQQRVDSFNRGYNSGKAGECKLGQTSRGGLGGFPQQAGK